MFSHDPVSELFGFLHAYPWDLTGRVRAGLLENTVVKVDVEGVSENFVLVAHVVHS